MLLGLPSFLRFFRLRLLLLLEHHLDLVWVDLIGLVLIVFNLLLAALNLHLVVIIVVLNLLLLLQDPNLIPQKVKILLFYNLAQMLLREWELLRMLIIFLLQVLQQHVLLIGVKFIQVNHHIIFTLLLLIIILIFHLVIVFGTIVLLHVTIILNVELLLTFLGVFLIVVTFFGLVDDVLLHNELLAFSHLV